MLSLIRRYLETKSMDRLGPDMVGTHWKLHFPKLAEKLCSRKFKNFGRNAQFRPGAYAMNCSSIEIGDNVVIRPQTMLFASSDGKIIIENDVLIASNVKIHVNNHQYKNQDVPIINQGMTKGQSVILKSGCWIGTNAVILPGVTVGKNAVVAAGAVVVKDVNDFEVVGGVPAKKLIET